MWIIFVCILILSLIIQHVLLRRYIHKLLLSNSILKDTQAKIIKEVDTLITDLNSVADRNLSIIEERIAKLSTLLSESTKHIKILRKYPRDKDAASQSSSKTSYTPQSVHDENANAERDINEAHYRHIDRLHSEGKSNTEIARIVGVSISEVESHLAMRQEPHERT